MLCTLNFYLSVRYAYIVKVFSDLSQ